MAKEPTFDPDAFAAFAPAPDSPAAAADAEVRAATRKRAGLDAPFDPDAFAAYAPKEEEPFNPDAFSAYVPEASAHVTPTDGRERALRALTQDAFKVEGAQEARPIVDRGIASVIRGTKSMVGGIKGANAYEAAEKMRQALSASEAEMDSEVASKVFGGDATEGEWTRRQRVAAEYKAEYDRLHGEAQDWLAHMPEGEKSLAEAWKSGEGVLDTTGNLVASTLGAAAETVPQLPKYALLGWSMAKAPFTVAASFAGGRAGNMTFNEEGYKHLTALKQAGNAATPDELYGQLATAITPQAKADMRMRGLTAGLIDATMPGSGAAGKVVGHKVASAMVKEGALGTAGALASKGASLAASGVVEGVGAGGTEVLSDIAQGKEVDWSKAGHAAITEATASLGFNAMEAGEGAHDVRAALELERKKATRAAAATPATPAAPAEAVAGAPAPVDTTAPAPAAPPKGERKLEPSAFVEDDAVVDEVAPEPIAPVETVAAPAIRTFEEQQRAFNEAVDLFLNPREPDANSKPVTDEERQAVIVEVQKALGVDDAALPPKRIPAGDKQKVLAALRGEAAPVEPVATPAEVAPVAVEAAPVEVAPAVMHESGLPDVLKSKWIPETFSSDKGVKSWNIPPDGTVAVYKPTKHTYAEVVELRTVPIDDIAQIEGEKVNKRSASYAEEIKQGNEPPPVRAHEFIGKDGIVKLQLDDGHHRVAASKLAGRNTVRVWVALTDKANPDYGISPEKYMAERSKPAQAEPAPTPKPTPGELALGAEADAFALTPESVRDEAPALEARVAAAEAKAAEPVLPGMEEAPVKRTPEQVAADADTTPDELLAQQAAAQAEADAAAEAGDARAHEQAVGVVSNRVEAIYDPERVLTAEQWVDGIPKSWRGEDGAPDFTKLDGGKLPASGASSALMHALHIKEFAAQAEAELDRRARNEAHAEAKEMTGDTLADVLRTGQVKLPSIDRLRGRDTKGEFNQLRRDFDGRWSGLVDSRITLQDTLGQLSALGFGFESEADLVEALKRTAEGKDVYASHIEYDKAADHPGDIGNPDIQPGGTAKVPAQVPGDRLAAQTQGAAYDPTGGAAMAAVDTVSAVSVQGMATMLAGADVKLVVKHMAARGMFVASALGREIRLNIELMKGNVAELARVLAHEIGHLDDYLPTETLARGNIGGRLLSIKNHLKQVFPIDGVTYDNAELQATLKELREGARLKAEAMQGYPRPKVKKGMSDAEVAQTKALAKEWDAVARAIYAQDADAALPPEGFARAAAVHQELLAWSKKLKPWDEAGASPEYNKYRRSSKELYADAISGILVFPEAFAAEAPLFWRAFFRNLDAKSQVAVDFAKMQQFMRDPDAMYAEQADIQTNDFNQGGDIYLARIAEEDAAKKLVINSVKHIWEAIQQAKSWKDVKETVIKPVASEVNTRLIIPLRQNFTDRAAGLATTKTKLDIGDGNYWSGKVYAYSARMRDQVVNVLAEGGVDLNVFDRYMGLKRIAEGDRSEEVNRFLQRGEDAAQAIIALRKGMTPDQLTALNKAEVGYRANMRAVLADMVESGMIAPSQVAQWRAEGGDAYVPFASLKHFEGYVGAGFKAVVGDAGGHVGVTLTGLLKMMNMVRAAEFNKQFKALLEGAREGGIPIVKATGQATGAGRIVFDAPKPGWALVEVWTNGAREGWYYPKEFQPAFTPVVPLAYSVEAQILKGIFKSTWNKAWIDLNLKFMAFTAPVRDMQVMTFAVPGGWRPAMEIARGMALRALEVGAATLNGVALRPFTDYELTIPDKLLSDTDRAVRDAHNGKRNIVADAMIEHGGLTPPQHLFDETEIDNAITMANEKNGSNSEAVLAFMRRQKLITDPETQVGVVRRALRGIIKELEKTVQYSETTAKVAAYRHLVERQGMDPKTAAQFVRHHVGIPSTMENGRVMRFVGAFLPFANVAVAGIKADANIMFKGAPEFVGKGKGFESAAKVRAQFWMKFAGSVGVYSVLCGAARSGLLGEEMEEWWARVPELDMRTGIIIPVGQSIGTDGRRKSDYIKVPMPPGYAWLASGFRESGRAFEKDRTAAEGLRVVFGSMLDTLPSIDPTIASMAITGQYIAGNNPNDPRTGRPILSQAEQDARLKDSSAANLKIIQSILAQTGLYAPKKDKGAPDPEFASWQWLSEAFAARSVFKSQHYGEDERLRHEVALDKAEDAALWSHLPDRLKSLKTEASLAQESRKLLEENVMKAWAAGRAPVRADAEALARGRVSMDFLKQWNRLAPELKELNRKDKAAARQVVGKIEEIAAPYYPGSEQRLALEKMLADRLMRKWEPYDESP